MTHPVHLDLSRRRLLLGGAGIMLAAGTGFRAQAADAIPAGAVLRAGDQKGGCASVLRAAGLLDGLPYKIEWSQFPAAAPLLEALNAGAVDTAYAADAPTTFALAAGVRGKVIAASRSSGAGTALLVAKNSPIQSIADLKGKRIGTNRGSIGFMLVTALVKQQGWNASDVTIANLLPADAKAALAAGSIDAWSTWAPYVAQAQLDGGARVIVDGSKSLLTGLDFQTATDDAIHAKRAVLADYARRLVKARIWAKSNVDAYAAVFAKEVGVTEAVAKLSIERDWPLGVAIDDTVIKGEQSTADLYHAARVIPDKLDVTPYFDASFNAAVMA
jgi:sulfonate transport system substrate-binding protein